MNRWLRHLGIFCLTIVLAYIVADQAPLSWDARDVFVYFLLAFFLYLGLSYVLESRKKRGGPP